MFRLHLYEWADIENQPFKWPMDITTRTSMVLCDSVSDDEPPLTSGTLEVTKGSP